LPLNEAGTFFGPALTAQQVQAIIANTNRNVVVMSQNVDVNARRGHVMFMHSQNVQIHNAGFYGLGRTDKRNPVNDPVFDEDCDLVDNTGLNRRGRYAVHFHRTGVNGAKTPAVIDGSVVVDSPGWGFVNHDSFVHMADNVGFDVVGAAFVTEVGNEIGSFRRNLAIHSTGSGDGLESREDIFDFGHQGHGFWFQGPGVEVEGNIAANQKNAAFIFFTESSEALFDAANMTDPTLAAGRAQVPVGSVPLRLVRDNLAFASGSGLETWFHLTNMTSGQSYIENFTAWNTHRAMFMPYTGQTTVVSPLLIGNRSHPYGTAIGRNDVTNNITYTDVHLAGWEVGIDAPMRRATSSKAATSRRSSASKSQPPSTRTVHGMPRTFFIFGDVEAPTFQLSSETKLVINPLGLDFGFNVHGTILDNSFGHMAFHKRFTDLRERPIVTRPDGSQYILLEFTIRDLAGNTTAVALELTLDPTAPVIQGAEQRDLPPRELAVTLYELLQYYMITGQTDLTDLELPALVL
jgi:hypothetical protein